MFPVIEPLRLERMKVIDVKFSGDLAKMLNLSEQMGDAPRSTGPGAPDLS